MMSSHHGTHVELASVASGSPFDTSPPQEPIQGSAILRWKQRAAGRVSAAILPIVRKVARPYAGGETVDEAMCVADHLAKEGTSTTLGFWDTGRDNGRQVADIYLNTIERLSAHKLDSYVSLKPPALRFASELAGEIAGAAAMHDVRLHCDSHGTEVADNSNAMLQVMAARLGGQRLGTTLPGRWPRSLRDAEWAVERALNVRVVKGQWPDPADPKRDLSAGFLEVIGRLAGRARHVAVATHDFPLASEAIRRLRAAGTPCEIELLLGMPARPLIRWAKQNGVKVRIYVPFGSGFIPNAIGVLKRNPRLMVAVAKEYLAIAGGFIVASAKP